MHFVILYQRSNVSNAMSVDPRELWASLPPALRRGCDAFGRVFGAQRGDVVEVSQPLAFYGDDLMLVRLDVAAAAHLAEEAAA